MKHKNPHPRTVPTTRKRISFSTWFSQLSSKIKVTAVVLGIVTIAGTAFTIYQVRKDSQKEKADQIQANRRFRILVPLFASNQEYLNYMKLPAHAKYRIEDLSRKVSSDTAKTVNAARSAWLKSPNGVSLSSSFPADKVDFYFYPEGTNDDSYRRAYLKALDEAKNDGYEPVAIMGHVTSTVTLACGDIYRKITQENNEKAKSEDDKEKLIPLPMILPLSTATSLTYSLSLNDGPAVVRLPPANDRQTELISDFLNFKRANRVTIVKDLSNTIYSDDLIDSFHSHFVDEPFRNKSLLDQFQVQHGEILATVPAGGTSGEPFLHTGISSIRGDALLLFAMTEVSLETIAEARAIGFTAKYTLLTDGAIDEHLIPRANALISGQGRARAGVVPDSNTLYLTFPLDEPLPGKLKGVLAEVPESNTQSSVSDPDDPKNLSMTHAIYVTDAVQILLTILYRNLMIAKNPSPGRDVISSIFHDWQRGGKIDGVSFSYDPERIYQIDAFGNSINMKYHLFKAILPGIVKGKLDLKAFKWVHDKENCKWERPAEHQNRPHLPNKRRSLTTKPAVQ